MVSENINVRIKFSKTGRLKFISHLDLNRTMRTALVRAKIPVWYSKGFNPHPKIVFSLPLSIGTESVCEFMDFRITQMLEFEELRVNLNKSLAPELDIVEAYAPITDLNEIGFAEYEITVDDEIDMKLFDGPLITTKRTKKGEKTFDVQQYIKRYDCDSEQRKLTVLLSADGENYLNPDNLMSALTTSEYDIMRTNIYRKDGETVFK